jgi:2Fe-2S ferredoxin
MLSPTPERTPTSRLSCQIEVSDALEGLVVQLPAFQM